MLSLWNWYDRFDSLWAERHLKIFHVLVVWQLLRRTKFEMFLQKFHWGVRVQRSSGLIGCPGLVDFVVRLVEFILHLPDRQVKVYGKILH